MSAGESEPTTEQPLGFEEGSEEISRDELSITLEEWKNRREREQPGPETAEDDQLRSTLAARGERHQEILDTAFEAWSSAFAVLKNEAEKLSLGLEDAIQRAGLGLRFSGYDMLSKEKYRRVASGLTETRTWLFGLDLWSDVERERLMFFFQRMHQEEWPMRGLHPVSLSVSRFDGERFRRLRDEPIRLREIAYADGDLIFRDARGAGPYRGEPMSTLRLLINDVLSSYLK